MRRALLAACVVALTASAPLAQGMRDRDRDGDEWRDRDRRVWQEDDDDHHHYRGRGGRGAGFFLRSGDSSLAVRCDPSESMRTCLDTTLTLVDRLQRLRADGGGSGGAPSTPSPRP